MSARERLSQSPNRPAIVYCVKSCRCWVAFHQARSAWQLKSQQKPQTLH